VWNRFVPEKPVDLVFYDDFFNENYGQELQTSKVLKSFALLAISIACLGLFGLASFTVGRRSKEIGIRKVLGASVSEVVLLLSREFIKWVVIANVVAWPIAYYIMNRWLEGFAYRINFGMAVFVIAGFAALVIAVLTVSYQAIRAARANPVDAIQYE
jgi:putative ABC transport system permease protein